MRSPLVLLLLAAIAYAGDDAALEGTVFDPAGKPLAAKPVTAYCVSSDKPLSRTTKTDDSGLFRLDKLPAGTYVIELAAPKHRSRKNADALEGTITDTMLEL